MNRLEEKEREKLTALYAKPKKARKWQNDAQTHANCIWRTKSHCTTLHCTSTALHNTKNKS